jgi:2,3-bisphosphoglycerate-independent phosphoglycerate mutase
VPGHDNKPFEKKEMIEFLDRKFFSFLAKFAEKNNVKVLITADHSTPCKLKGHSADPVPVLLCDWSKKKGKEEKSFNEKEAKNSELGKLYGKELLKLLL